MTKQPIWQGTEVTAPQKAYSGCALLLNRKLMLTVTSGKMDCTKQTDHSLGFRQILGLTKKHLEDEWPKKGNSPLLSVIEQWIIRLFWQTTIILLWCRHYWQAGQLAGPELSVSLPSERILCSWTPLETIKRSHSSPAWCTGKSVSVIAQNTQGEWASCRMWAEPLPHFTEKESHPWWELNEGLGLIVSFREYSDRFLQIFGKYFGYLFASNTKDKKQRVYV